MGLTRRQALAGTAGAVAGAAGIYALVDGYADTPKRPPAPSALPPEQHLLDGVQVVTDNGVEVLVPPLHHAVVTATVAADDLDAARRDLEDALAQLESRYPATPAGLGITVAWGLPYFRRRVSGPVGAAAAGRRPSPEAGAARRDPLLERSGGHRAGAERRGRPAAQRQPGGDRDGREAAVRRSRRAREDHRPAGLRGWRAAAEARAGGRSPRSRPDPPEGRALPRLHLDAEGEPRPVADREPRDARPRPDPAGLLHGTGRTCTSRTSTRTWKPGT